MEPGVESCESHHCCIWMGDLNYRFAVSFLFFVASGGVSFTRPQDRHEAGRRHLVGRAEVSHASRDCKQQPADHQAVCRNWQALQAEDQLVKARQAGASHGYHWRVTVHKVTFPQAKRLLSTKKAFLISIRRTAITKVPLPLAMSPLFSVDWPHSRPQGVTPRTHASYPPPLLPAPCSPFPLASHSSPLFTTVF